LLEAGRGVFGTLNGRNFVGDTAALRAAGVTVGLVFHGSEIRDPRAHAATHAWSPFSDASSELTARLQRQYDALAPLVADFDGPKFVSTPDLIDYVPDARWLPLVIDTSVWTPQAPPLERAVPVVVHAPSHTVLKGTQHVESVLQPLADRGLIDYRRIQNVAPSRIGPLLADADVVIDQMLAGSYGVLACEGVALGRVVVGYLGSVRAHVGEVPILEATPDTLGEVMTRILDDRESVAAAAASGPAWIATYHDGRMSAQILNDHFLATGS
jgi:hypothetical protein